MNRPESGVFDAAGLLAFSLYAPGTSIVRAENVATPATALTGPPPVSVAVLPSGLKPRVSVTAAVELTVTPVFAS